MTGMCSLESVDLSHLPVAATLQPIATANAKNRISERPVASTVAKAELQGDFGVKNYLRPAPLGAIWRAPRAECRFIRPSAV